MNTDEKLKIMQNTAKGIVDLIDRKIKIRTNALVAFDPNNLNNLPDDVKRAREQEAQTIRAVLQELMDLQETIKIMYPDVQTSE